MVLRLNALFSALAAGFLMPIALGQEEPADAPQGAVEAKEEQEAVAEEAPIESVELQFLTMPSSPDPLALKLIDDSGKATDIVVMSNMYSQRYLVSRSKNWKIAIEQEGQPLRILGEAPVIKDPRQMVLLIRSKMNKEAGYQVMVFPNEIHLAAAGDMLVRNLAKKDFRAVIGDFDLKLKTGEHQIITPKAGAEGAWTQSTLSYRKEDKWKEFMDRRWPINETVRSAVYFYEDPGTQKIQLHTLTEVPPSEVSSL